LATFLRLFVFAKTTTSRNASDLIALLNEAAARQKKQKPQSSLQIRYRQCWRLYLEVIMQPLDQTRFDNLYQA
jgi:hypothetical protein